MEKTIVIKKDNSLALLLFQLHSERPRVEFDENVYKFGKRRYRFKIVVMDSIIFETFEIYEYRNKIILIHGCWEHPWNWCSACEITREDLNNIEIHIIMS